MKILITGGSGFLGTALRQQLPEHEWAVYSRQSNAQGTWFNDLNQAIAWQPEAIINLAGESLFSHRWSTQRWQAIVDSRIGLTQRLLLACQQQGYALPLLISGSAIGYYPEDAEQSFTEDSPRGQGLSSQLCHDWEQAALDFSRLNTRVIRLRTGLVMAHHGGALSQLLPLFKFGLGGPLGFGQHYWSWIGLTDWCRAVAFLLADPDASGAYNLTAPQPIKQKAFASALGKALHRPALLPTPTPALYLSMGKDRAHMLLASQRVLPERLLKQGFQFEQPHWPDAAAAIAKG